MMTLDAVIEKLQKIRSIAPEGGETTVYRHQTSGLKFDNVQSIILDEDDDVVIS